MQIERDYRFKHILYIDMDNVLMDFRSGLDKVPKEIIAKYADDGTGKSHYDDIPGIYSLMEPVPGAIEAIKTLAAHRRYKLYILSDAPWGNPGAWSEKLQWVKKHLDSDILDGIFYKKLILTHHKNLFIQQRTWLIDSRQIHGAEHFDNHLIQLGTGEFPDWSSIVDFFIGAAPYSIMRTERNQAWMNDFLALPDKTMICSNNLITLQNMPHESDNRFKRIIYFDMDNVLVDFQSGLDKVPQDIKVQYADDGTGKPHYDDIPGLFSLMNPMPGAVEAVKALADCGRYDLYILSTAPWGNPSAWSDKLEWVKKYLDSDRSDGVFYKKLILTHHKNLCIQQNVWLIDDRTAHGAEHYEHHLVRFGTEEFPDWDSVVKFLLSNDSNSKMRMTRKKGWSL